MLVLARHCSVMGIVAVMTVVLSTTTIEIRAVIVGTATCYHLLLGTTHVIVAVIYASAIVLLLLIRLLQIAILRLVFATVVVTAASV